MLFRFVLCQISSISHVCFMIRIFRSVPEGRFKPVMFHLKIFTIKGGERARKREQGFCCMLGGYQGALP